eukprot:GILJ01014661.1.p1 GENE.GILJ01014661.1~~GILJ01014661.1.p1  ORF type:complete len:140 (-),score=5.42 GILJ01014661.1:384-803(-)
MPTGMPSTLREKRIICNVYNNLAEAHQDYIASKKKRKSETQITAMLCGVSERTVQRYMREEKENGGVSSPQKRGAKPKDIIVPLRGPHGISYCTSVGVVGMYMRDIIQQLHAVGIQATLWGTRVVIRARIRVIRSRIPR